MNYWAQFFCIYSVTDMISRWWLTKKPSTIFVSTRNWIYWLPERESHQPDLSSFNDNWKWTFRVIFNLLDFCPSSYYRLYDYVIQSHRPSFWISSVFSLTYRCIPVEQNFFIQIVIRYYWNYLCIHPSPSYTRVWLIRQLQPESWIISFLFRLIQ